ncbi:Nif3-like dinuclear metal center hexameric protein [Shouchella patagoniensis]|uniref:Nif3-like dinuclear metal center hexameric protein n=1 Tax=Shouchella patagoniensis TaxID=228576 RepID=UPI000994C2BF|nr:Nif3-like dinuclear metal center hexameric protein [Shouchella patagoniensis]
MKKDSIHAQQFVQLFEQFAPKQFAMEGDKNGLMIGTLNKKITNVMIALDVLEDTMDEAIEKNVDFILAHHPLLFRPLKQIDLDTTIGRIIKKAIEHNITIYAAHTNLDVASGGVNDLLAEKLEIESPEVLVETYKEAMQKIVVFVPVEVASKVRAALGDAGAGFIGSYSHCSFSSEGTGSFYPEKDANPHIGKVGRQEYVDEVRIETIIPSRLSRRVVAALVKAHPYEEPVYDLYPLDEPYGKMGLGRIGKVPAGHTLRTYVEFVKQALNIEHVRVVGDLNAPIKKAAILGGDGNKYVLHAKRTGADVLITGDLYYHVAQDALMEGMFVIDAGHHIESIMKEGLTAKMSKLLEKEGYDISVFASVPSTEPFKFM